MATSESMSDDMRRSTRLALAVPVEVLWQGAAGEQVSENATTKLVSKHGACVMLEHRLELGAEVLLQLPHMDREQKCIVVWVEEKAGGRKKYETGLELEHCENFWGIQFPPEDWTVPKGVPLAGEASETASPDHHQPRSPDPQWLGAMLNALVDVLEEKAILSRAELSEKLKRMS